MDAAGTGVRIAWHLTADHDHGPEIPCMPAILLARRLAEADPIAPGAYACLGLLRLGEFEPEFSRWGMRTEIVNETTGASTF